MKKLTHCIKFAGVWEAGALEEQVEVLHNKTKSAVPVCAHRPDSGHFNDVGAWGHPHGASLSTKEHVGELKYCNKCYPKVLLSLKVHSISACDNQM